MFAIGFALRDGGGFSIQVSLISCLLHVQLNMSCKFNFVAFLTKQRKKKSLLPVVIKIRLKRYSTMNKVRLVRNFDNKLTICIAAQHMKQAYYVHWQASDMPDSEQPTLPTCIAVQPTHRAHLVLIYLSAWLNLLRVMFRADPGSITHRHSRTERAGHSHFNVECIECN